MLTVAEIAGALTLLLALLMASIVEAAFGAISRTTARRLLEDERPHATALNALVEQRGEVQMALDILVLTLVAADSAFLFSVFYRQEFFLAGAPATVGIVFLSILVFRHLGPRLITARNPEHVLLRLFPFVRLCAAAMLPFAKILTAALHHFKRWEAEVEQGKKEEETSDEEIQAFIDAGEEEGILESGEGEMIQSIVHFGNKVARELMTPRTQIAAIDVDASIENLLDLIVGRGHARIPVFRGNIDSVEGVIHERDLLSVWRRGDKVFNYKALVRPVQFIPESKPVDDLLREMKQHGDQLALVVDEYGGVSGLITMEDLVEEIVGEIHDTESDAQKAVEEGPGVYVVPGDLELSALDTLLGAPFVEQTECTTVAGAVVELFGKLPAAGEHIEHRGVAVEVLEADRRRVYRLRMSVMQPAASKPNGNQKQSGSTPGSHV